MLGAHAGLFRFTRLPRFRIPVLSHPKPSGTGEVHTSYCESIAPCRALARVHSYV